MKQNEASQTDWARVLRDIDEDAPIPFDDEDRGEGLYDPNNDAEVEEFLRSAIVIYPDGCKKLPVSLHLSEDVLAYYRAKGENWQTAIDEVLRRSMGA